MIVCSGPNCQTTVGCQCHGAFGRYQITSDAPVVVRKIETAQSRAFAAGRLAGLREAAALVRGHEEVVSLKTAKRSLDPRSDGNLVGLAYEAAILALAEGKEG